MKMQWRQLSATHGERTIPRQWPCWHLDPGFPASRTVRKLSHPVLFGYGSLACLRHSVNLSGKEKGQKIRWEQSSLVAQMVKHLYAMQETRVQSLGWEDPLEKEMAAHSSILAWKIPWTAEPSGLLSMGLQRVRHDWTTSLHFMLKADLLYCLFQAGRSLEQEILDSGNRVSFSKQQFFLPALFSS